MKIIAALLVCLIVRAAHTVDLECPNTVSCPCGSERVNVTICLPNASVYEEVCASLSKCENCDEGLCSKCPEGLEGPFCSQEIIKSRQKRQYSRKRTWGNLPSHTSSCSSMESPKLGSIRCVTSHDLQTCTGKCLPGYHFINSPEDEMVLTCSGGKWSPRTSFPACKSRGHCDMIVSGSGSFNCTTGMDGTLCDVRCSGSYAGRFFCYPGRNWEPALPRCVKPKNPVETMERRQECVCISGEICNNNGQCISKGCPLSWTRAECDIATRKKSCPDPGFIPNGYRQNADGSDASVRRNFEEGESVVYGCMSEEDELKGHFILTCKQDGTWSRSRPSCVKPPPVVPRLVCPDPGQRSNAKRLNTDGTETRPVRPAGQPEYPVGHSLVYTCVPGYALQRRPLITCLASGRWSHETPYCIRIPQSITTTTTTVFPTLVCRDPGQVANANRLNSDGTPSLPVHPAGQPEYPVGHSLVYTCVPGYALERRSLITCLSSGKWSYQIPYCRRIPSSTTTTTTTTAKPAPDMKRCRDPGVDPNGIREPSTPPDNRGFPAGTQLTYSCNEGFELIGKHMYCHFQGRWLEDRPICKPMVRTPDVTIVYCEYPGDISDGRVFYIPSLDERKRPSDEREDGYAEGSQLQYSCNDGFMLEGPETLTCQNNGRWSSELPKCEVIGEVFEEYCLNPGPISNGQVVYRPPTIRRPTVEPILVTDPDFTAGSRLRYTCNSGYRLVGRSTLVCLESGSWSVDKPVCRKVYRPVYCNYPGDLGNGQMVHRPPPNEMSRPMESWEQYPSDSRVEYSCHQGYTLDGPEILECLRNGSWSAKPPTCITEIPAEIMYCEDPGLILNGRVLYFPPAVNQRTGPGPSLDYLLEDYPEGGVLEYNCDEGFRLVGRRSITCQSSSYWNGKPPACELECGHSLMQTDGKVFKGFNTSSGDWPWVVSISVDDNASSPFICGGAILNTHTVITAAHCLTRNVPLLLRFGKHHFRVQDDDTQVLTRRSSVSEYKIHPDFSTRTLDSDIAIIKFQPRIRYSHLVQPICLPTQDSTLRNIEPGQNGYIGGWGVTEKAMPPDKMMLAILPVVSDEVCTEAYRQQNLSITRNMFCAGYEDNRQIVCGGDSGSPFVFYDKKEDRYTLEGLVSFGVIGQCGVAGKYAIFTKVFRFILWITKNSK